MAVLRSAISEHSPPSLLVRRSTRLGVGRGGRDAGGPSGSVRTVHGARPRRQSWMAAIQGLGLDPSNPDGAKVLASAMRVNRTRRSDGRDHSGPPSNASSAPLPGLRSWIAQSIGIPKWDKREPRPATSISYWASYCSFLGDMSPSVVWTPRHRVPVPDNAPPLGRGVAGLRSSGDGVAHRAPPPDHTASPASMTSPRVRDPGAGLLGGARRSRPRRGDSAG